MLVLISLVSKSQRNIIKILLSSLSIKISDFICNQKNFHCSFYSGYLKNKSPITLFYEKKICNIQKPLTIAWKLFEWRCKFFNLFSISICFHFDRKCEINFPTSVGISDGVESPNFENLC